VGLSERNHQVFWNLLRCPNTGLKHIVYFTFVDDIIFTHNGQLLMMHKWCILARWQHWIGVESVITTIALLFASWLGGSALVSMLDPISVWIGDWV